MSGLFCQPRECEKTTAQAFSSTGMLKAGNAIWESRDGYTRNVFIESPVLLLRNTRLAFAFAIRERPSSKQVAWRSWHL
jgi:hypothetical protein